jgi:hypothetical protein
MTLDNIFWIKVFSVLMGYLVTLTLSGIVVRTAVSRLYVGGIPKEITKKMLDTGTIVGKCENIVIVTLVLYGAYTALGLVFAGKSLVRSKAMQDTPEYYLVGTLVNFTFSLVMGFYIKFWLMFPNIC